MSFDATQLFLVAQVGEVSIWSYEGVDAAATVIAGTYIPDGYGLNVGDLLIVTEYTSAAKTAVTDKSLHTVTAVASTGVTGGAALAGGTAFGILSGTASPDVGLDVLDGALVGTLYVETDVDEPYVCVSNGTAAAIWQSIANDVMLGPITYTVVTAGAVVSRLVAPFGGRVTQVLGVLNGVITGTDKLIRSVISGNTIGSGSLTLTNGSAAGTVFAATPTTDNVIAAQNVITLQSGAQAASQATVNFFVVCRKMTTS